MTYEELAKKLKDGVAESDIFDEEGKELISMIIVALEKQTLEKPTLWGDGCTDGELIMKSYECPECGCIYDFDTDGKLKFCSECGQALDWSNTE